MNRSIATSDKTPEQRIRSGLSFGGTVIALVMAAAVFGRLVHARWLWYGAATISLLLTCDLLRQVFGWWTQIRTAQRLVTALKWCGDEFVLNVECGSGDVVSAIGKQIPQGKIVGTDLFEHIYGTARFPPLSPDPILRRLARQGMLNSARVISADYKHLPFRTGIFEVVVCRDGHHIFCAGDRRRALREMIRVLRPGGTLVLLAYRHEAQYKRVLKDHGFTSVSATTGLRSFLMTSPVVVARKPSIGTVAVTPRISGSGHNTAAETEHHGGNQALPPTDGWIMSVLACPSCDDRAPLEAANTGFCCTGCQARFAVRNDIPELIGYIARTLFRFTPKWFDESEINRSDTKPSVNPTVVDLLARANMMDERTPDLISETEAQIGAQIVDIIGSNSKAIEQASTMIFENGISLDKYVELCQVERERSASRGLDLTCSVALAHLELKSRPASELARTCAFLYSAPIPVQLLTDGARLAWGRDQVRVLCREAQKYALLRWDPITECVHIDPAVSGAIRFQMSPESRLSYFQRVVGMLADSLALNTEWKWDLHEKLGAHCLKALEFSEWSTIYANICGELVAINLRARMLRYLVARSFVKAAYVFSKIGHFRSAVVLHNLAFGVQTNLLALGGLGPRRSAVSVLAFVGDHLFWRGRYQDAEVISNRLHTLLTAVFGVDHPSSIVSASQLLRLYIKSARYPEAEALATQKHSILQRFLGAHHMLTIAALGDIGIVRAKQARFEEGESLIRDSLSLLTEAVGSKHRLVSRHLNDLAVLYRDQRRFEECEPLFLNAIAIEAEAIGEKHPSTAHYMHNLAMLYLAQGRKNKARRLLLQVLAARRDVLGADHPELAELEECCAGL